jgi:hypothetical protein
LQRIFRRNIPNLFQRLSHFGMHFLNKPNIQFIQIQHTNLAEVEFSHHFGLGLAGNYLNLKIKHSNGTKKCSNYPKNNGQILGISAQWANCPLGSLGFFHKRRHKTIQRDGIYQYILK